LAAPLEQRRHLARRPGHAALVQQPQQTQRGARFEGARAIALKLIDGADVVAENFRPGVMDKLGFGYDTLRGRKPSLIYASASGYGPDGPYAQRPGQDLLAQELFGVMAITGQQASGPRPVGVSAVDHHGAGLFAMGS